MRRCATATVTSSTAAIATVNALLIIALSPIGQRPGKKLEIKRLLALLRNNANDHMILHILPSSTTLVHLYQENGTNAVFLSGVLTRPKRLGALNQVDGLLGSRLLGFLL